MTWRLTGILRSLACAASSLMAVSALCAAQTPSREKLVDAFVAGEARVEIAALWQGSTLIDGEPYVQIWATQGVNRVLARFNPDQIRGWVGGALTLATGRTTVGPGEAATDMSEYLGKISAKHLVIVRRSTQVGATFDVVVSDEFPVHQIFLTLPPARTQLFVKTVLRALDSAVALGNRLPRPKSVPVAAPLTITEPFALGGLRIGDTLSGSGCSATDERKVRICKRPLAAIGSAYVEVEAALFDEHVFRMTGTFWASSFDEVLLALTLKYGTPSLRPDRTFQAHGATYTSRERSWQFTTGSLILSEYGPDVQRGVIEFVDIAKAPK